ncbi:amylo-alpha-1,6-glucosidase [Streptosporangiaceae bacterium NEAU-GS5]|nr:amylo-alpha-1,6-glucosidase [Streptosporangiaceae bacterium NEAU-GS5]
MFTFGASLSRGDADLRLQPPLHDLVGTVMAATCALSDADGQIRAHGAQGLFHADRRVLSQARLLIDGHEPEPVGQVPDGPGRTRFVGLARHLGDRQPDPSVRVERVRTVRAGGMEEIVEVASTASATVTTVLSLELGCDFAEIEVVKSGGGADPVLADREPSGLTWRSGRTRVTATGEHAAIAAEGETLTWEISIPPRDSVTLRWSVTVDDPRAVVAPPATPIEWPLEVAAGDPRLSRLLGQVVADLRALQLVDVRAPGDVFIGAGVPWFLTLFGRDSLWAARMLLPLGVDLAAGTLRVLARRQGVRSDPGAGEAPGKIMHELRREAFDVAGLDGVRLPDAYYGTIDATLLWISLLHDAWRWGLPDREVAALMPNLEAALGWLGQDADADGDGFVEYADASSRGLANQGWKDSSDAVRFHDGRQAAAPIALAEVQGYAYQAARDGAALLAAFGRPGAARWHGYADAMAERFRARFWVDGPAGHFPALALDAAKRPVDSLTSNIGHLLGIGMLSAAEEAEVAAALATPAMSAGFGLRTMSELDDGFSPLSYHCGSIWPHDTAIVIAGLARSGFDRQAAALADGLLAAGETFGYRLPELYAGDARSRWGRPLPYPAACRPQAWSAAAAVTILHVALGLYPDVPDNRVTLRPLAGAPLGWVSAQGLRVAGADVGVTVDRLGAATVTGLPTGLTLDQGRNGQDGR